MDDINKDKDKLNSLLKRVFGLFGELDEKRCQEIASQFKSIKGKETLKECVKLCVDNAERLHRDAQNSSLPTKSFLLELAMEEAHKGYTFSFVYLYFYDVEKMPIFMSKEELQKYRHTPIIFPINILHNELNGHLLKSQAGFMGDYLISNASERYYQRLLSKQKEEGRTEAQIEAVKPEIMDWINKNKQKRYSDLNDVKKRSLYVDLNYDTLEISRVSPASEKEIEQIEKYYDSAINTCKSFLSGLGNLNPEVAPTKTYGGTGN